MMPSLFIMHIIDDFGNQLPAAALPHDAYMRRYEYFNYGAFVPQPACAQDADVKLMNARETKR